MTYFPETEVDAVDVCLEGQFLVVCEKDGNLHLIYVPQKRILFTRVCVRALYVDVQLCLHTVNRITSPLPCCAVVFSLPRSFSTTRVCSITFRSCIRKMYPPTDGRTEAVLDVLMLIYV